MEISRDLYKQVIAVLKEKGGITDASQAMDVADAVCEIFEKIEIPEVTLEQFQQDDTDFHSTAPTPAVGRGTKSVMSPAELAKAKQQVQGSLATGKGPLKGRPGQVVPGGYFNKKGEFVPTPLPITSAMTGKTVAPETDAEGNLIAPAQ